MTTEDLPPGESGPDLLVIRRALARRILDTSLRGTAREVGLSPTGLKAFVDSISAPYTKTREKMADWYVRRGYAAAATDDEAREVGIAMATRPIPAADVRRHAARIIARLVDAPSREMLARVEEALREPEPEAAAA